MAGIDIGVTDTGLLSRGEAARELQENYVTIYREPVTKERAKRILDIAQEFGRRAEPCDGGFVHVVYRGWSQEWPYTERFQVYNHANPSPGKVARSQPARYTSGRPQNQRKHMKEQVMPARAPAAKPTRGRRPAPKPVEPEVEEEEYDFTDYLTKDHTPTMADYVEWFTANVADPDELESDRLIVLGARLYNIFQKSQFNIDRREARRAERGQSRTARAAANGEGEEVEAEEYEEEEAPAKPAARRGRGKTATPAAATVPARPARKGRKPAAGAAAY
jgi:hypothetical protein